MKLGITLRILSNLTDSVSRLTTTSKDVLALLVEEITRSTNKSTYDPVTPCPHHGCTRRGTTTFYTLPRDAMDEINQSAF